MYCFRIFEMDLNTDASVTNRDVDIVRVPSDWYWTCAHFSASNKCKILTEPIVSPTRLRQHYRWTSHLLYTANPLIIIRTLNSALFLCLSLNLHHHLQFSLLVKQLIRCATKHLTTDNMPIQKNNKFNLNLNGMTKYDRVDSLNNKHRSKSWY